MNPFVFTYIWAKIKPDTPAKQKIWVTFGVLFLCLFSFICGYASHKGTVTIKEKEKIVYQDKIVEKKVYLKAKDTKQTQTKDIKITKNKDGSEVISEHVNTGTDTKVDISQTDNKTDTVQQTSTKDLTKTVSYSPNWHLGVQAGLNMGQISLKSGKISAGTGILGIDAERHVIGPVWGGVWANTQKEAGLTLSLEF